MGKMIKYPKDRGKLIDFLVELSKPFNSRNDWSLGHNSSYCKARREHLIDKIAEIHGWERICYKYPEEKNKLLGCLVEFSKPFSSRTEWALGHCASYQKARIEHLIDKIAEIHGWERMCYKYPEEEDKLLGCLVEFSKPFSSRKEWERGHDKSYQQARKKHLIDKIAEIHGWECIYYKYPEEKNKLLGCLVEFSKPFSSRKKWSLGHPNSYYKAQRDHLIDKVAEIHGWESKPQGYNRDLPGTYYIECINGIKYNTGITNRCLDSRYYGERLPENEYIKVLEVKFEDGRIPPLIEKEVLELIKDSRWGYNGPKLYRHTGNTEIFVCEDYTRVHEVIKVVKKWENMIRKKKKCLDKVDG